jgi:hypothetical protein
MIIKTKDVTARFCLVTVKVLPRRTEEIVLIKMPEGGFTIGSRIKVKRNWNAMPFTDSRKHFLSYKVTSFDYADQCFRIKKA